MVQWYCIRTTTVRDSGESLILRDLPGRAWQETEHDTKQDMKKRDVKKRDIEKTE